MANNYNYRAKSFSKLVWGLLLFLAAAFIIANQIGGFIEIGFWSILVGTLALAYTLACLIRLKIDWLPIPLAILYIILQSPLNLPEINTWLLIVAAILASIGLSLLLPRRLRSFSYGKKTCNFGAVKYNDKEADFEINNGNVKARINDDDHVVREDYDNNPVVSVSFGGESRYLHANALETVNLSCKFGALEVYFDQAMLNPKGANVFCNCNFGAIELYVPKEWRVIADVSVTLGATEVERQRVTPAENAPTLIIKGSVSFGAIEVKYV